MRLHLPPRPSGSTVISFIALFVAMGGAAYAGGQLAANSVGTEQLRDNDVRTQDIRDANVRDADIRGNAVKSRHVDPNTLTGEDIDESTLANVSASNAANAARADNATNADNAANADKLDDFDSSAFARSRNFQPFDARLRLGDSQEIVSQGPISVVANCVQPTGAPVGDVAARLLAVTTAGFGTVLNGDDNFDGSNASGWLLPSTPADGREIMSQVSAGQATQHDVDGVIDSGFIAHTDGAYIGIDAETTVLGVNFGGNDCFIKGVAFVN